MDKGNRERIVTNKVDIISAILIVTSNINGLNTPIKRHCQRGPLRKDLSIHYL